MRVISGLAGGIPLTAPKTDLRPTMDRVKKAIFDSLGESVVDSVVLDLFAGSGSLGIEALSRGAKSAVLVEKDARAVETIHQNLLKTRLKGATVHALDIFSYLDRLAAPESFHIIIADPPYAKRTDERDFTPELLNNAALLNALTRDGLFILEKLPGYRLPAIPAWELIRERRYGATEVAYFRKAGAATE